MKKMSVDVILGYCLHTSCLHVSLFHCLFLVLLWCPVQEYPTVGGGATQRLTALGQSALWGCGIRGPGKYRDALICFAETGQG